MARKLKYGDHGGGGGGALTLTDAENKWVMSHPKYTRMANAHGDDDARAVDTYLELAQKAMGKRDQSGKMRKLGSITPMFHGFQEELFKVAASKASLLNDLARFGVMGGMAGAGTYGGQKLLSKANLAIDPELYGDSAIKRTRDTAIGGAAAGGLLHAIAKAGVKAR